MAYSDDFYAAHRTKQASISASSTAAQVKAAETTFYRALYQASIKWGVENGAAAALQSRGERLPSKDETP